MSVQFGYDQNWNWVEPRADKVFIGLALDLELKKAVYITIHKRNNQGKMFLNGCNKQVTKGS